MCVVSTVHLSVQPSRSGGYCTEQCICSHFTSLKVSVRTSQQKLPAQLSKADRMNRWAKVRDTIYDEAPVAPRPRRSGCGMRQCGRRWRRTDWRRRQRRRLRRRGGQPTVRVGRRGRRGDPGGALSMLRGARLCRSTRPASRCTCSSRVGGCRRSPHAAIGATAATTARAPELPPAPEEHFTFISPRPQQDSWAS